MKKTFVRFLALALVFSPLALSAVNIVHAASNQYTLSIPSSDMNKYSLEGSATVTQTDGSKCQTLAKSLYSTKAECTQRLSQYSDSTFVASQFPNPPYSNFKILDSCSQITKSSYTYTFSYPACANAIALGLKPVAATGGDMGGNASGGGDMGGNASGGSGDSGSGSLENPLNVSSLPDFLTAILKGVVEIGAIFLTFMIVYVGFLFVSAQGNPEKLSSARSALIWVIIGGLILLGAEAISLVIQETVKTL